jgi:hypothetical protein
MIKKMKQTMARSWAIVLCFVLLAAASIALTIGTNAFAEGNHQQPAKSVRITKGPVIEFVSDDSAVIAWSTNVKSGTTLRYGTTDHELAETFESKHAARTHRVHLIHLRPNTTYYYQVETPQEKQSQDQSQDPGATANVQVESFHTSAKGQKGHSAS